MEINQINDQLTRIRLRLSTKAFDRVFTLIEPLHEINFRLEQEWDYRSENTNTLILRPEDTDLVQSLIKSSINYDFLIERRRRLMQSFSTEFNLGLSLISLVLIDSIEYSSREYYVAARTQLVRANQIIDSLNGEKITGLRVDVLSDLYSRLLIPENSMKYGLAKMNVAKLIKQL